MNTHELVMNHATRKIPHLLLRSEVQKNDTDHPVESKEGSLFAGKMPCYGYKPGDRSGYIMEI